MSEIPKTDSVDVAKVAVAWEITKMSVMGTDEYIAGKGPEKRGQLVNAFVEIFNAVIDGRTASFSPAGPPMQAESPAAARQAVPAGQAAAAGQPVPAGQPQQARQPAAAGRPQQAVKAQQAGQKDNGGIMDIRDSFKDS